MASSAVGFPLRSMMAGIREKNLEGEESEVVDVDDCLSFLIQETNV